MGDHGTRTPNAALHVRLSPDSVSITDVANSEGEANVARRAHGIGKLTHEE
jgi:hypothetical protein